MQARSNYVKEGTARGLTSHRLRSKSNAFFYILMLLSEVITQPVSGAPSLISPRTPTSPMKTPLRTPTTPTSPKYSPMNPVSPSTEKTPSLNAPKIPSFPKTTPVGVPVAPSAPGTPSMITPIIPTSPRKVTPIRNPLSPSAEGTPLVNAPKIPTFPQNTPVGVPVTPSAPGLPSMITPIIPTSPRKVTPIRNPLSPSAEGTPLLNAPKTPTFPQNTPVGVQVAPYAPGTPSLNAPRIPTSPKVAPIGTPVKAPLSKLRMPSSKPSQKPSAKTKRFELLLTMDLWPEETSWILSKVDNPNNQIVAQSNYTFTANDNSHDGETFYYAFDLTVGIYEFLFKDTYGDGICCGQGFGSYTLKVDGKTIKTGGEMNGNSETTSVEISFFSFPPTMNYLNRSSSAPVCSSITKTIYLSSDNCSNITYSKKEKQIEVSFCDKNEIAGFRIYNYSALEPLVFNLYGYIGMVWTYLDSGKDNAASIISSTSTYLQVNLKTATYPKFRLTLPNLEEGFDLKSFKFLQCNSTNCEKSYKFRTKEALQMAIDGYTSDNTKKEMMDTFGVINCWDTGMITDMSELFYEKTLFDEDISCWDCSKVRNMSRMFYNARSFKREISRWNISSVEDMSEMFFGADSFQSSVMDWDVSKVTSMTRLFYNTSSFNQDLCPWYNHIGSFVSTDSMFSLSGCNDRSDPNVTSKTAFCHECSCCGGSCFNPVGNCEDGYTCDASTNVCTKPVESESCRLKKGESYGCQGFYECHQFVNGLVCDDVEYTGENVGLKKRKKKGLTCVAIEKNTKVLETEMAKTAICTKPLLGSICSKEIGCLNDLVCSTADGTCVRPALYEFCDVTGYGCVQGFTCDASTHSCRIPHADEACLPWDGTSFGCDPGLLCEENVCVIPTLNDICLSSVGCASGYYCDNYTSSCRKAIEGEGCIPKDGDWFGCQDGLVCTNVNLLARADNSYGNILAKSYRVSQNTTELPGFESLSTLYRTTYVESIDFKKTKTKNRKLIGGNYFGVVFEGLLSFPAAGLWTLYVRSSKKYNLIANGVSLVKSDGSVAETASLLRIFLNSTAVQRIRLELLDTILTTSSLEWKSDENNQERAAIPSDSWIPDKFSCSKPLGTVFDDDLNIITNRRRARVTNTADNPSRRQEHHLVLVDRPALQARRRSSRRTTAEEAPAGSTIRTTANGSTSSGSNSTRFATVSSGTRRDYTSTSTANTRHHPDASYYNNSASTSTGLLVEEETSSSTSSTSLSAADPRHHGEQQAVQLLLPLDESAITTTSHSISRDLISLENSRCDSYRSLSVKYYRCEPQAGWCSSTYLQPAYLKSSGFLSDLSYETTDKNHGNFFCFGSDSVVSDNSFAEITGYIKFPYEGTWTFYSSVDDASRIYLDDNLKLSGTVGTQGSFTYVPGPTLLAKLKVQVVNFSGGCAFQLEWTHLSTAREVIPWFRYYSDCEVNGYLCKYNSCVLPTLNGDCNQNVGCEIGYTCQGVLFSNSQKTYYKCLLPQVGEVCRQNYGCASGYVCSDYYVCRLPTLNEKCTVNVGCVSGYKCGSYGICDYPSLGEPCNLNVGCGNEYSANMCMQVGSTYKCQLPRLGQKCNGQGLGYCEVGFTCDVFTRTCRLPTFGEKCLLECLDGYTCDGDICNLPWLNKDCKLPPGVPPGCQTGLLCLPSGSRTTCQKPSIGGICTIATGCNAGYICDKSSNKCRLPVYLEACEGICAEEMPCKEKKCDKPTFNERCTRLYGCQDGYKCKYSASGYEKCQKPDMFDESCVTSIGCLNGYACDQTTKKCRLPNWNEACVENCADGFACHGGKCDIPISGDKCISGIKADYYDCQPQAGWCISGDYKRSGFVSDLSYETTDMNHGNVYCFGSDSQMSVNVRAVFTGYIKFPYSGTWIIYSVVDDASRIYMDGNLTLSGQAGTQGTFTYNPGQNVLAKLTVQAVNFGGGCVFQLEWSHANQQRQVIPASAYVSGCSKSNLICDSASNICRKPDVNEACVDAIGCQEDSFCKNNTCVRKPGFNEDCEEMGCKNGLLCLPTEKYIGCFNDEYPDLALPNDLGEGISKADCLNRCRSLGYAYAGRQWYEHCLCGGTNYSDTHYAKYGSSTDCQCDSDNIGAWVNCVYQLAPKTCKKPTLNGDCVRSVGCDDGYECDILLKKCYPFECVESIGCLDGLNCENKLCQRPSVTQHCSPQIGCSGGLTCDLNSNTCHKPDFNEACLDEIGCKEGLYCKNSKCAKPLLKELCIDSIGCSDDTTVCRSTLEVNYFSAASTDCSKIEDGWCSSPSASFIDSKFVRDIDFTTSEPGCFGSGLSKNVQANFAAQIQFPYAGNWTIYAVCDDICMIYMGSKQILINQKGQGETSGLIVVSNTQGIKMSFTATSFQGDANVNSPGDCTFTLLWSHPKQAKQVIPASAFSKICMNPTIGEICSATLGCDDGYICDQTTKTCRLPQLKEACAALCAKGFLCSGIKCEMPTLNQVCTPSVGCQDGYICKNTTCKKPIFGESCNSQVQCADSSLLCEWAGQFKNYCRYRKYAGEACNTFNDCFSYASCSGTFSWERRCFDKTNGVEKVSIKLSSYGSTQDYSDGSGIVIEANSWITLYGNAWKSLMLSDPYKVTTKTVLSFTFLVASKDIAEGHAICVDEDNDPDTYAGQSRRCLALNGTQIEKWDSKSILPGKTFRQEDTTNYKVPLVNLFDISKIPYIRYIAFIQDNDAMPSVGTSTFRNIELKEDSVSYPSVVVTAIPLNNCTCSGNGTLDFTGRPIDLRAIQDKGFIRLNFTDNSKCEEAFSFTRSLGSEEFILDKSTKGVSYASDYYAYSKSQCGSVIAPGIEAADDLRTTLLNVGQLLSYCVRAVGKDYMTSYTEFKSSSDESCTPHVLRWEASIKGKITTKPSVGSLPIPNVTVAWYALDPAMTTVVLDSGSVVSSNSGEFVVNVQFSESVSKKLYGSNGVSIPFRVTFFKELESGLNHEFLCDDGVKDCSSKDGTIVFLKHLQFDEKLTIYDNSAVPVEGVVSVQGAECFVADAQVCLYETTTTAGLNRTLVCGPTDSKGWFSLPVIIGSTVNRVFIAYHGHTFLRAPKNEHDYDTGLLIKAGGVYVNNDFVDVTTASLTVEVAGGACNERLGRSTIQVKIVGCPSSLWKYDQPGFIQNYRVPAHFVSVQVTDIKDDNDKRKPQLFDFFQGNSPVELFSNLTNATDDSLSAAGNGTQPSKVRFEYNGEPRIKFKLFGDLKGSCLGMTLPNYESDSFHIVSSGSIFFFRVDIVFEIDEGVTCDMAGDNIKLRILSMVGADPEQDKIFLSKQTKEVQGNLTYCAAGCTENITRDESGHKAGLLYTLAAGRPNILSPYAKDLFIQLVGASVEVTYKASIVVIGDFEKEPGQSFSFPTHYPVMILRDPPGGKSYASYQNVLTTAKIHSHTDSNLGKQKMDLAAAFGASSKSDACVGASLGVITMGCTSIDESKTRLSTQFTWSAEITEMKSEVTTNEISTVWSFKTSQDPWLAGSLSDVFVVPDFNVMYQSVTTVSWNATSCQASSSDEIKFDLKAADSKAAFAFFSRWHVLNKILPELNHALAAQTDEKNKKTLQDGINGWNNILARDARLVAEPQSLSEMFTAESLLPITSTLVSPYLLSKAESLTNVFSVENSKLEAVNRLQFSGGGNMYTLTLSNQKDIESTNEYEVTKDFETNIGVTGEFAIFKVAVSLTAGFMLGYADTNTDKDTKKNTNTTEVSFVLADDDIGDEFVVEIFKDKTYGSIIFKTIAGQSRCPREENTAKFLDPRMSFTSLPSSFVTQDDPILFEVELVNVGIGKGEFILSVDNNANDEELSFSFFDSPFNLDANEKVTKLIQVNKGPRFFQYKPVELVFREACVDDVYGQQVSALNPPSHLSLTNVQSEIGSFLEFVEPCPDVEWAGELKRDQNFLVNILSGESLPIVIRNPNYKTGKLQDNHRLGNVFLYYRQKGDVIWTKAFGEVEYQTKVLDFKTDGDEDNYGFVSNLNWLIKKNNIVPEGTYEIKVEARCNPSGGPKDYDTSSTFSITGIVDITSPELFGSPLPLQDHILTGEAITFVFTEALQCNNLDVKMFTDISLNNNQGGIIPHQVFCNGNQIKIVADYPNELELMGKKFTVEIDENLADLNGNPLKDPIKVVKTFADLNIKEASTSFDFFMDNVTCSDSTVGALQDKVKEKIKDILGFSSTERIQVIDLNCVESKRKVTATVNLTAPTSNANRHLSLTEYKDYENSVDLFYKLRDATAAIKPISRMLSYGVLKDFAKDFKVGKMKIIPGITDIAWLKQNTTSLRMEKKIRSFGKAFHSEAKSAAEFDSLNTEVLEEIKLSREEAQEEHVMLRGLLEREQMHEVEMKEMNKKHEGEIKEIREEEAKMNEMHKAEMKEIREEEAKMNEMHKAEMKEIREEEAKMNEMRKAELKEMHEKEMRMLHELSLKAPRETDMKEMKTLVWEMTFVIIACMSLAVGLLHLLKRRVLQRELIMIMT